MSMQYVGSHVTTSAARRALGGPMVNPRSVLPVDRPRHDLLDSYLHGAKEMVRKLEKDCPPEMQPWFKEWRRQALADLVATRLGVGERIGFVEGDGGYFRVCHLDAAGKLPDKIGLGDRFFVLRQELIPDRVGVYGIDPDDLSVQDAWKQWNTQQQQAMIGSVLSSPLGAAAAAQNLGTTGSSAVAQAAANLTLPKLQGVLGKIQEEMNSIANAQMDQAFISPPSSGSSGVRSFFRRLGLW